MRYHVSGAGLVLAASGHHIPHNVADALGWAVVIVAVAAALLGLARILKGN